MKKLLPLLAAFVFGTVTTLMAQEETADPAQKKDIAKKLLSIEGALGTIIYTLLGIVLMILAYKAKDLLIPGKLNQQLVEEKNNAIAIVTGSFLIGIAIIIAAAITG